MPRVVAAASLRAARTASSNDFVDVPMSSITLAVRCSWRTLLAWLLPFPLIVVCIGLAMGYPLQHRLLPDERGGRGRPGPPWRRPAAPHGRLTGARRWGRAPAEAEASRAGLVAGKAPRRRG